MSSTQRGDWPQPLHSGITLHQRLLRHILAPTLATLGRLRDLDQQIAHIQSERNRQLLHVIDGHIALAAFDRSDIGTVQPSTCREFLL